MKKEFLMNKTTLLLLLIFTLAMTACSGNRSNGASPAFGAQTATSSGGLSTALQVAIGTIKLDNTEDAVTAVQAQELLPLWETLKVLESSDTAATQEKDALIEQIQETMSSKQTQAIAAMNLTRQDMFAMIQSQGGVAFSNGQNVNGQNSTSTGNNGRNFGAGGFAGGPPPDGAFPGEGQSFSQGQNSRTQSNNSTQNRNAQSSVNPNRVPTALVQAVIEYLKKKADS
jgi:hypothetical protein